MCVSVSINTVVSEDTNDISQKCDSYGFFYSSLQACGAFESSASDWMHHVIYWVVKKSFS